MQERYLTAAVRNDAFAQKKMAFLSGPRQVGKTTLGKGLLETAANYFSWDDGEFRKAWVRSPAQAIAQRGPGPVLFDELHKERRFKTRLKGLYDIRGEALPMLVTGSARLDWYRRGGDSLLGRYFPYRMHPFTVNEAAHPLSPDEIWSTTHVRFPWADLVQLTGFPEPLLGGSALRAARWSRLRRDRLVLEDVRDLRAVADMQAFRVLTDLLPDRVGSLLSVNALKEDVGVAYATVRAWVIALEALYFCFFVRPYHGRIARALRAEPKVYLYDGQAILPSNKGARAESLIALHLLKACHYWTDTAAGNFDLRFVRDKEKREVDFLLLRDGKPWMLVECKSGQKQPSKHLLHYARLLTPTWSIQVVDDQNYDRMYPESGVRVMGYERFCAGLV